VPSGGRKIKRKIIYLFVALALLFSLIAVVGVGTAAAAVGTPLSGYGVVTSVVLNYGDGGWGGWSVPAGKVVLGGGFYATAPVAVSVPGTPNSVWEHYTYGPAEYGWVVRDAPDGVNNTITIYAIYADAPPGYGVVTSVPLNYADGGWGGWSVPPGKVVLGGGFYLTGGPASVSAPGTPGSIWPHYTYGSAEYGWVVRDAPDGKTSYGSTLYAIYADEPTIPPTVITKAVSSVTTNSATLQGNLTNLGTDTSVLVSFVWATEAYYTSNGNTYLHETTPQGNMTSTGTFSFPLSGLLSGTTYHYRTKAIGSEAYGEDKFFTTSGEPGVSDGGGCFIATAAYGSYLDSHVDTLRSFRDQYLETNPIGSAFVSLYYKVSPPMADFIEKHPTLKPIVRAALMPAVAMSSVALNTTLAEKAVILVAIALFAAALIMWLRQRTRRLERR
jgi:hypothetical protein